MGDHVLKLSGAGDRHGNLAQFLAGERGEVVIERVRGGGVERLSGDDETESRSIGRDVAELWGALVDRLYGALELLAGAADGVRELVEQRRVSRLLPWAEPAALHLD